MTESNSGYGESVSGAEASTAAGDSSYQPFTLKRWNGVATWAWDVECDTCAICRVHLMEECLKCQTERSAINDYGALPKAPGDEQTPTECVVVWGDCSHSFHNCCMAQWVKNNPRCPLCQKSWNVQRIGK